MRPPSGCKDAHAACREQAHAGCIDDGIAVLRSMTRRQEWRLETRANHCAARAKSAMDGGRSEQPEPRSPATIRVRDLQDLVPQCSGGTEAIAESGASPPPKGERPGEPPCMSLSAPSPAPPPHAIPGPTYRSVFAIPWLQYIFAPNPPIPTAHIWLISDMVRASPRISEPPGNR